MQVKIIINYEKFLTLKFGKNYFFQGDFENYNSIWFMMIQEGNHAIVQLSNRIKCMHFCTWFWWLRGLESTQRNCRQAAETYF